VHLRFARRDLIPAQDAHPHARRIGDDLVVLLSVKQGDQVCTPPEETWDARGGLDLVESDLFFTSSTALVADWLLRRFTPTVDASGGLLVVVPNRLQVAWRPVPEGTALPGEAVEDLAELAARSWSAAPGPMSREVFWVQGDEWAQVTSGGEPLRRLRPAS
jgi:hypothetical protein